MAMTFAELVDRRVLVGLTYVDADDVPIEQVQFVGHVVAASGAGVVVRRAGRDSRVTLPPDLDGYTKAEPGEYRLRMTGEVVSDPDFVCSWRIRAPSELR